MKITYLGIELDVTYHYRPPYRDHRGKVDEYEGPEECEIITVCMMDGINITALFSEEQFGEIAELIKGELNNVRT